MGWFVVQRDAIPVVAKARVCPPDASAASDAPSASPQEDGKEDGKAWETKRRTQGMGLVADLVSDARSVESGSDRTSPGPPCHAPHTPVLHTTGG